MCECGIFPWLSFAFVIGKHVTFIHSLLEYLPVFTPCKWEQNVVSVTGAKEYGECVNIQPEFDVTVGLLIALICSIISVIITTVFAPVFDVLNLSGMKDDVEDSKKAGGDVKVAPAPFRQDLTHEDTRKLTIAGGYPCMLYRNEVYTHYDVPSSSMLELSDMISKTCLSSSYYVSRSLDPSAVPHLTGQVIFDRLVFDLYNYHKNSILLFQKHVQNNHQMIFDFLVLIFSL